jgi:hypothetical protein
LSEYERQNKSIKNIERKITITPESHKKLSKMNLRAVRESVAKQDISSSGKRQSNLTHVYDVLSENSANEQNYLSSIHSLLKNN